MKDKRWLRAVDFLVSFGTIGYGVYAEITWLIAGGLLGLVFAFLNPAKWVESWIRNRFVHGSNKPQEIMEEKSFPTPKIVEASSPQFPLVYRPTSILDMNGLAHHLGNPYRLPIWFH